MLITAPVLAIATTGRSAAEGRPGLDDVADIGHRLRLPRLMYVGDDRHAESLLHFLEDLHPLFQTGPRNEVIEERLALSKLALKT